MTVVISLQPIEERIETDVRTSFGRVGNGSGDVLQSRANRVDLGSCGPELVLWQLLDGIADS